MLKFDMSPFHTCLAFLIIFLITQADPAFSQVELGDVIWSRDLDNSVKMGERLERPVFILFQEVPGCHTCRTYGRTILSHPLIVEAIQTLFIPVAIYNNKGGKDADALTFFHEPAWNNPVVRIVDKNKRDLTERVGNDYTEMAIVDAMIDALESFGKDVPLYLKLLQTGHTAESDLDRVYLSMYCFWTGEKVLGSMKGVAYTEAGFMHGHEVVLVEYIPEVVKLNDLIKSASASSCADAVYCTSDMQMEKVKKSVNSISALRSKDFRPDDESKYYLRRTDFRHIPITKTQAMKINSSIALGEDPEIWLSPIQLRFLMYVRNNKNEEFPVLAGQPLLEAWSRIEHLIPSS